MLADNGEPTPTTPLSKRLMIWRNTLMQLRNGCDVMDMMTEQIKTPSPPTTKQRRKPMPKYIIRWNAGYGDSYDVVEADSLDDAHDMAYQSWNDEAQSQAEYDAEEYTDELAEEYGV